MTQVAAAGASPFTFDKALRIILRHEGGLVNHPSDPGGMTNLGATRASWSDWIGRTATDAEMRALTPDKVAPFYRTKYWDAVKGDALPPALALCVFDFAVNAGPGRSARMLQKIAGVDQDGAIGPRTLAAVQALATAKGLAAIVGAFQEARRGYYRGLDTFKVFGKGWLRRVDAVETDAVGWIK